MAANVGGASVSPMKSVLRGSCLCGVVTYEISEPFLSFVHCHCSRCRKATGSAHATNLRVPAGQFTWTSGQEKSVRFDLPEAQSFATTFCSCCGSPLPHLTRSGRSVIVPAGSLDGEPSERPSCRPQCHAFWDSRSSWSCGESDLPRVAEAAF